MILITGANGQLGQDFQKLLTAEKVRFIATDRDDLDITSIEAIRGFVSGKEIKAIINCAAYNAVDQAEADYHMAYKLNSLAVRNLATVANELGAELVHYSTDYVYDGKNREEKPYLIFDEVTPLSKYGHSKYCGEKMALDTADKSYVIRTSWVFGMGNTNFVKKILEWSAGKTELKVVDDQISSPAYTVDLAKATYDLMKTKAYGLYHMTNSGYCSRLEWAQYVLEVSGWQGKVLPSKSADFKTPAERPEFSVLDNFGLKEVIGYELPHWKDATDRFLKELKGE
jgi:dTDP-4-dehydrorhamnose reductase